MTISNTYLLAMTMSQFEIAKGYSLLTRFGNDKCH